MKWIQVFAIILANIGWTAPMKVKIFREETSKGLESEINSFLSDRKDIKVIDIREIRSTQKYIFMILYEYIDGKSGG